MIKTSGADGSFGRAFHVIKAAAISSMAPFSASGALRSRWRSCRHLCAADDPVKVIEQLICAHFAAPLAAHDIIRLRYARVANLTSAITCRLLCASFLCNNTTWQKHAAKNARRRQKHAQRDTRVASFHRRRLIWTLPPPNGAFAPSKLTNSRKHFLSFSLSCVCVFDVSVRWASPHVGSHSTSSPADF